MRLGHARTRAPADDAGASSATRSRSARTSTSAPRLRELLSPDFAGVHSAARIPVREVGRDTARTAPWHSARRQADRRWSARLTGTCSTTATSLIVELDGRAAHPGDTRWKDIWRDNAALVDGIMTLRFGWDDLRVRPCLVADQVYRALRRSAPVLARPCSPTCPVARTPDPASSTPREKRSVSSGRRKKLVGGEELSELFAGRGAEAFAGAVVEFVWMAWSWAGVCWLRLVPLGRYSRSRPLTFSLLPRCQGARVGEVDVAAGLAVMRACGRFACRCPRSGCGRSRAAGRSCGR